MASGPLAGMNFRHLSGRFAVKCTLSTKSYSRPPFYDVLPPNKMMKRILFELDSRLTLSKLYPLYKQVYESMDSTNPSINLSSGINATDLMIMKKALEKIRYKSKSINKNLLALENELLYKAAELGDNNAVSLLAFDVLNHPSDNCEKEVKHAKELIKQLHLSNHPLSLKLMGDFALKNNNDEVAEQYFLKFLHFEKDTSLAGEVYGQLGKIFLRKPILAAAEEYFLKSIKYCTLEYSVHSYFYLGQLYISSDPIKAKALTESAATQGFRESFMVLGNLEMNYFSDFSKALEWFKLGMELSDIECFIGGFDCAIKMKDFNIAKKCLNSMTKLVNANSDHHQFYQTFLNHREDKIKYLEKQLASSQSLTNTVRKSKIPDPEVPTNDRWNI
ncbi:Mss2p Ecym_3373 [Eremothecium cymbalariae DBVPG|uniref:Protein MSS2, mitochondrial n=1 Tax=Eremothecium cymbalariae (strain CBS 270.75 / DBVPG 7215 / KCTC 17166 / NRRL Y-17582) TaxID=931890 RepID=G8JRU1_ERECY|nr:Hypothetical protein Ecym_3373 [Eremothecium cymbalariae DBVPG\